MKNLALVGILAVAGLSSAASAFEYRVQFVERVGTTDTVIDGNTIDARDGAPRRIRIQFGVFDDATSAAPAGGLLGWNVGTITVNGGAANSDETRTNGRITPWNFAQGPNSNGNPPVAGGGDPFETLSEIDATQGTQSPPWPSGERPPAVVRGRNTFASVYEITINPADGGNDYSIDFAGNLLSASEWIVVNENAPDPDKGTPGTVVYAPFPTDPTAFAATLNVLVPAPGAAALLGLGGLVALRRRR